MIVGLIMITAGLVVLAALFGGADGMAVAAIFGAVLWLIGGGIYYCVAA